MSEPKKPHEVKLGYLIQDGDQLRDAIHIAVAPVTAGEDLKPGDHVGLSADLEAFKGTEGNLGIVDPYLTSQIKKGSRFWLLLYPQTITSLRHEWTHDSFPDPQTAASSRQSQADADRAFSKQWIQAFAAAVGISYERCMNGAAEYVASGAWGTVTLSWDTPSVAYDNIKDFWEHYEKVTGESVEENRKTSFFSCAC